MIVKFRNAETADIKAMKQLFKETIASVCKDDYDELQRAAWSSSVQNAARWSELIVQQYVLLAIINNQIVGFGSLLNRNHIDFFYVHKDYQKQGIAQKILTKLEQESGKWDIKTISGDISITAKGFFEKNGFEVIQEQQNFRNNSCLINYKMVKQLSSIAIKL